MLARGVWFGCEKVLGEYACVGGWEGARAVETQTRCGKLKERDIFAITCRFSEFGVIMPGHGQTVIR